MILEVAAAVYVLVATFLFGIGVGDESGFVNPNYVAVARIAALWPIYVLYAVGLRLFDD